MRVLIQRVSKCSVSIDGNEKSNIEKGMLVLAGFEEADQQEDLSWIAAKLVKLRIFDDSEGVMNLSLQEVGGDIMVVSQFTLHAQTKKGNRPSYIKAARPELAVPLYNAFIECVQQELGKHVATGEFGANMQIELVNDGPVSIWIDSKNKE